jgi:voltage-gated potassium channel Kch
MRRLRGALPVPPWVLAATLALGLGAWGWARVEENHRHLDLFQTVWASLKLFVFDLEPAARPIARPSWQLAIAAVLAAALTIRAILALLGHRIREWFIGHRLHAHIIVCGAGALGSRLARDLDRAHDVVLIDIAGGAAGLSPDPDTYVWPLQGDATLEHTLCRAGVRRAAEVIAVTNDGYVNSRIVTAVHGLHERSRKGAVSRLRVLIQVEEPGLARFFEERGPMANDELALVIPFSTNAVAARALLAEKDPADQRESPELRLLNGQATHLLLAGDHPLLEALMLEALRRWRAAALERRDDTHEGVDASVGADGSGRDTAGGGISSPVRVSLYGADAVKRVEEMRHRWTPEPQLLEIDGRNSASAGEEAEEAEDWLKRLSTGAAASNMFAIVACNDELVATELALSVGRALGKGVPMIRVAPQTKSTLDTHIERHTNKLSSRHARTEVVSLADLACDKDAIRRSMVRERLAALLEQRDLSGATEMVSKLMARGELEIHSTPAWHFSERETPMLRALIERDGVPLDAFVSAGLAINLNTENNLLDAAELLVARCSERMGGHHEWAPAFAASCEYARAVRDPVNALPQAIKRLSEAGGTSSTRVLELLAVARLSPDDVTRALGGRVDPLAGAQPHRLRARNRVAIFAGGADSMSQATSEGLGELLGATNLDGGAQPEALYRYRGVVLCGGTDSGICKVVGEAADRHAVPKIGYLPEGKAASRLYPEVRETERGEFSEREPLAMWTDILAAGIKPEEVTLIACPGGEITYAEILLARALGARVGWIDPHGEAELPLEDILPGGAERIVELPRDAMCIRALIAWSVLEPRQLRKDIAALAHADYRATRTGTLAGDPAIAPWERLLPAFRDSNLSQANDIPNKLAMIGLEVVKDGRPLELKDEAQILLLSRAEHGRFVIERLSAGWRLGDRAASRRSSPYLQPWDELDEEAKGWDRDSVLNIARALQQLGYGVRELTE